MSTTQKQDQQSQQPCVVTDLPSAIATAVMGLDWANTYDELRSPEEHDEVMVERHGEIQKLVERQLAALPAVEAPEHPGGLKPTDLTKAAELVEQWHKLCKLEAASRNPLPGSRRLRDLSITSLGMGRQTYFDEADLNLAGIDLDELGHGVLILLRCKLSDKLAQVLAEMQAIGVNCQELVDARTTTLANLQATE